MVHLALALEWLGAGITGRPSPSPVLLTKNGEIGSASKSSCYFGFLFAHFAFFIRGGCHRGQILMPTLCSKFSLEALRQQECISKRPGIKSLKIREIN